MATRQRKDRRFLKAAGVLAITAAIALTPWLCNKWEKYKAASEQKPRVQQVVTREKCAQFIPKVPEEKCKEGRACFDEPKKNDDKCETNKGEEVADGKYYDPLGCYCGNSTCDTSIGEDNDTCPKDCPKEETQGDSADVPPRTAECGNRICEKGESKGSCSTDCVPCGRKTVSASYKKCDSDSDCAEDQKCSSRCKCVKKPKQKCATTPKKIKGQELRAYVDAFVDSLAGLKGIPKGNQKVDDKKIVLSFTYCDPNLVNFSARAYEYDDAAGAWSKTQVKLSSQLRSALKAKALSALRNDISADNVEVVLTLSFKRGVRP